MTRGFFVWMVVVAVAAFSAIEAVVPYVLLFHVQNMLAIVLGVVVIGAFWPALKDAFSRSGRLGPGHIMVIGVVTNWLGMELRQSSYYVASDVFGLSLTYVAFPVWALGLWLTLIGGVTHLIALRRPGIAIFQPGTVGGGLLAGSMIAAAIVLAWLSALSVAKPLEVDPRLCLPPIDKISDVRWPI